MDYHRKEKKDHCLAKSNKLTLDSMFTIDAHLDLSMNAMEWNRDLRKSIHEIRALEKGLTDKPDRAMAWSVFRN